MNDLSTVLADLRSDAAAHRRRGNTHDAEVMERIATDVAEAAEEYLTFVPESDASLFSGKKVTWLRTQFEAWARRGHAKMIGRVRYYRQCILPRRAGTAASYDAGVAAARRN